MKNLFDFATKELSQDAFLVWLFENYDCENIFVKNFAYYLLNEFNDLHLNIGDIKHLETITQYPCIGKKNDKGKMDVIILFSCSDNDEDRYLTVIEDKTYSSQHDNQLSKYNNTLKAKETKEKFHVAEKHISRIFYKTDIYNLGDEKACDNEKPKWKCYFINDIYKLVDEFSISIGKVSTKSDILDDYIEHIEKLYNKNNTISNKNMSDWDRIDYRTFYYKAIIEDNVDKRVRRENTHEARGKGDWRDFQYNYNYYIPKTDIRLVFVVKFSNVKDMSVNISLSEFANHEDPRDTKDEKRLDSENDKLIIQKFMKQSDRFKKSTKGSSKKYHVFAQASEKDKEQLIKSKDPVEIANIIKELLSEFLNVCEEISKLYPKV